jgi:ABC-2 type transport system permease protein
MVGLLLKDMYSLNKNIKQYGISSALFIFIAVSMKSSIYFVFMVILMSTMLIFTALANDEMSKWDKYALTMPVERREIVLSKYALFIVLTFSGMIISSIIGIVMTYFLSFESSKTILTASISGVGISCLLISIMLPLVFKYGVEKGRILLIGVMAVPTFLVAGGAKFLDKFNIPIPTFSQVKPYLYFAPVIILALLFISYKVSLSIYEKKEF